MNTAQKKAIKDYQCCGCVVGPALTCYQATDDKDISCKKHCPGTIVSYIGRIFLGMPTGFNRLGGINAELKMNVFTKFEDGWGYNKYNIPVWKYLSPAGHTLVRGLSPRNNFPFIHVFLENCIDKIECFEVDQALVDYMD